MCAVIVIWGFFLYNYFVGKLILHTFGRGRVYAGEGCRNHCVF